MASSLLTAALTSGGGAAVAAEPPFNPMDEAMIVGSGVTLDADATSGQWRQRPGRLSAPRATARRKGWWLAGGAAGALKDGQVRVRFSAHKKLDLVVLARAKNGDDGKLATGVGLRIRRGHVAPVKISGGMVVELLPERKYRQLSGKGELEVVLQVFGPHLLAALYDEPAGKPLAALSASGLPLGTAGSRIALLLGRRNDPKTSITLLTSRKACGSKPSLDLSRPPHIVVHLAGKASTRARKLGRWLEAEPGPPAATVLRTNPVGLERIFCSKEKLLRMAADLPWKYIDLDYLAGKSKPFKPRFPGFSPAAQGYLDPGRTNQLLKAFHKKYADDTRLVKLGVSHLGHKIYALVIGKGLKPNHHRPSILIAGAHHGDEPLSTLLVFDIISQLLDRKAEDKRTARWLKELAIWCVPLVNPDGQETFLEHNSRYGRKNGRDLPADRATVNAGVDLNRNYPFRWKRGGKRASSGDPESMHYRGPSAGSEPETRAIMRLAQRERFLGALTFHTGTVKVLAPYTIDGVLNPEPNVAWMMAEKLAEGLPRHPQKRDWVVGRKLYSVDGTDQDWLRHAHGTVALLLEVARWTPLKQKNRQAVFDAVHPLWSGLLQRSLTGPAIHGQVVDAEGKPVEAEVRIKEVVYYQKERWTTRPRDGHFARYLPGPGLYTLQVMVEGAAPVTSRYRVKNTPLKVQIKLP